VLDDSGHSNYTCHVSISETEEGRWAYLTISRDNMRRNPLWVADLIKSGIGYDMS
jgi:prolyl oligopeptidase